ncbi:hypothetical protein [Nocardia wallacei]|uniref:Uncharacterized protein n=1 Tax=Nocardia wallacei TaxID=480035 RepID=A0A7G1KMH3_9NOCA|nr:hypothetical protein [Nocardia wallacei]BCK56250.1 hypothetical protein NWFMUON74_40220 [Nocardia wallacei]
MKVTEGRVEFMGLTDEIAHELRLVAPPGWRRLEAWFAMTVVCETALMVVDDGTRPVRCDVPTAVWAAVRRHREASAKSGDGPWWRLIVRIDAAGVEVVCDRGEEPFPGVQLFAPDAYRADLEAFPRERLPVWLAAYIRRENCVSRPPRRATDDARADRAAGVRPTQVTGELLDLSDLWARWAVLSAAFVAAGSSWGPRVCPSVGVFEGAGRSGSTLALLPGRRAVLSGGVWNAPALDAAYNAGAAMPKLFAGAPYWVSDVVLNTRVATGLLSFCYWWESGQWYRGESAPMTECAFAMPAVWTVETMVSVLADLGDAAPASSQLLISAAQAGAVTREHIRSVFGDGDEIDCDAAFLQFAIAGLVAADNGGVSEAEAIALVRDRIRREGFGTTGFSLSTLTADRLSVGWMVHSPVRGDEFALDRAVFYVADDGVVEQSTESVSTSEYTAGFEQRYWLRGDGRF